MLTLLKKFWKSVLFSYPICPFSTCWDNYTVYIRNYIGKICAFPHILGRPSSWLWTRSHLNFLIYEENLVFFFISVLIHKRRMTEREKRKRIQYGFVSWQVGDSNDIKKEWSSLLIPFPWILCGWSCCYGLHTYKKLFVKITCCKTFCGRDTNLGQINMFLHV